MVFYNFLSVDEFKICQPAPLLSLFYQFLRAWCKTIVTCYIKQDSLQLYCTKIPIYYDSYQTVNHLSGMSSSSRDWDPSSGAMSPARRTFCLLTTFDLILTFILWVIYTQVRIGIYVNNLMLIAKQVFLTDLGPYS